MISCNFSTQSVCRARPACPSPVFERRSRRWQRQRNDHHAVVRGDERWRCSRSHAVANGTLDVRGPRERPP
eukprot:8860927-Pyramimonas_sp.AAC.1